MGIESKCGQPSQLFRGRQDTCPTNQRDTIHNRNSLSCDRLPDNTKTGRVTRTPFNSIATIQAAIIAVWQQRLHRHNVFFFSFQRLINLGSVLIRQRLHFVLQIAQLIFRDFAIFLLLLEDI
jgi:hypothetical protein